MLPRSLMSGNPAGSPLCVVVGAVSGGSLRLRIVASRLDPTGGLIGWAAKLAGVLARTPARRA